MTTTPQRARNREAARQELISRFLRGWCTIPSCSCLWKARGLCHGHYDRFMAHGDPLYADDLKPGATACPCDECSAERVAYRRAWRRSQGMLTREAWKQQMFRSRTHGPATYNRGCRCDKCRAAVRDRARKKRGYLQPEPTLHEKCWETFHIKRAKGMVRLGCKCGCGLYVNVAHVTVNALVEQGWKQREIAEKLGVPLRTIRWVRQQAIERSWPWYRKGHQRLDTPVQPDASKHFIRRDRKIERLADDQRREDRSTVGTHNSLDRALGHSGSRFGSGFTLLDTISVSEDPADIVVERETSSVLEWLVTSGVDLDNLADRCLSDSDLAVVVGEALESGTITGALRSAFPHEDAGPTV